ncbi:MAG: T9SS type A sorting domain-containing protein [Bacteroidota bacterium]
MKNQIKTVLIASTLMLNVALAYAGLDWSYGTLSNPDNLKRNTQAIAYASSGNVFVAGIEENSLGHKLIVTKKFSSTGTLLATVTNSYFFAAGITINDNATDIKLDANDNVYVLGKQYGSSSRGYDVVLIKYNSSLTQQWKKLIYNTNQPNNFNDKPCKILLDASSNVYVTGTWNNVTVTGFLEEIFVKKYSSSGTLLFSTKVPQAAGKTFADVTDMCIDNNLNVTVCAKATAGNVYSIMYARIANTGSLSWKKFYSPSSVYTLLFNPEIECTTGGTLYLATPVVRQPTNYDSYVRLATVKLSSSGTQLWENLTSELNKYADAIRLRLDASNNIYAGCDFWGSPAPVFTYHKIYKLNSSGALQWVYTSPESSSQQFTFETFSSAALFILFQKSGPVNPVLRKLDASNGNILWTEDMPFGGIPGYYHSQLDPVNIAVNAATSEVAFCGNIIASINSPNYVEEYRWHIRKYGATSPRIADEEATEHSVENVKLQLFPNPANEKINVNLDDFMGDDAEINVTDMLGNTVLRQKLSSASKNYSFETSYLVPGFYNIVLKGKENNAVAKFIVSH